MNNLGEDSVLNFLDLNVWLIDLPTILFFKPSQAQRTQPKCLHPIRSPKSSFAVLRFVCSCMLTWALVLTLGRPPGRGRGRGLRDAGTARRGTRAPVVARTRRGAPIDAPTVTVPCPHDAVIWVTGWGVMFMWIPFFVIIPLVLRCPRMLK